MVENYPWEIYTVGEYGGRLCLRCAAEEYIGNENNWIALTDEDIAVVTFDTLRQARHVLGVSMPVPKQIQLFDSLTLDSSSGGLVRGFSYADPRPEAAVEALREILSQAQNADHGRALLIIDGTYQFAFSIGVYVPAVMEPKQQTDGGGSQ